MGPKLLTHTCFRDSETQCVLIGINLPAEILQRSRGDLAEITEMIHTASLVHDDVVDDCDTRSRCFCNSILVEQDSMMRHLSRIL